MVLAGGLGRRVGGRDKGLLRFRGRPLAGHGVAYLAPACEVVMISANRNRSRYAGLADLVVADRGGDFAGPLAGIRAALGAVRTRVLITCPCDVPGLDPALPAVLVRRLRLSPGAEVAVLHDGERRQPLLLAVRGNLGASLDAYLANGGRSVRGWLDTRRVAEVGMPAYGACRRGTPNINVRSALGWLPRGKSRGD